MAFGKDGKLDVKLTENPYPTWKKLEEMVEKGKVKNIGVAKYAAFLMFKRVSRLIISPLLSASTFAEWKNCSPNH